MKQNKTISQDNITTENLSLIIPTNFGFENIEPDIQKGFDLAKKKIIDSGINIEEINLPILESYKNIPLWQFAYLNFWQAKCFAHGENG